MPGALTGLLSRLINTLSRTLRGFAPCVHERAQLVSTPRFRSVPADGKTDISMRRNGGWGGSHA